MIFILYGLPNCSYCLKAKELLNDMGIIYEYKEIKQENKTKFLDEMSSKTNNQRTFPLVFHRGNFIGGYTELDEYLAFHLENNIQTNITSSS